MTIARALKIDRESAAKFSFLLATPITLAAVIFDMSNFVFDLALVLGILASFLVGVVVIKFLLDYLKNTDVVIVGASPGSKYDDAVKLGITIWNEDEFIENSRR